jgi:DNA-binding NtrC family response regulator
MSRPPAHRILVVDDERLLHNVLDRLLSRHGMAVTSCMSAPEALEALKRERFDLVLTDFQMPEMDGLELLARIRDRYPDLPVVMITGLASVQHAVQAMHGGAVDYLPKPFSTDELVERLKKRLERPPEAKAAPARRAAPAEAKGAPVAFVGEHPSIRQLKSLIPRFARSKAPVFIHGESGTGKEVLAQLIHAQSDRATGPFVALNCANLPSELVESHLFGHRKGAFTGAVEDMAGAFARADGGTLLLDEVTEVAPAVQAKLLRVLQEGEFQRVGSEKTERVDVRVVATSNRDLQEAIREGAFREDLYHRLAVFPLYVPPLRERASDVRLLAEAFVERYCALYGFAPKALSDALVRRLEAYAWPGNVRELGNMVHRGVVLAAERTVIEPGDIINDFFVDGLGASAPSGGDDLPAAGLTIDEMERRMILRALREVDNNQERAAEQLGISSRTIRNKLKRYREEGTLPEALLR